MATGGFRLEVLLCTEGSSNHAEISIFLIEVLMARACVIVSS